MLAFLSRHQPTQSVRAIILGGIGGACAIALVGLATLYSHQLLLIAPFGASCVLLFSAPSSPFSQPANIIGGYFLATLIGLLLRLVLPNEWWAIALAVGLTISLMSALRLTHPPAGANPLIIFATNPGFDYLVFPVLLGTVTLVIFATLFHRLSRISFPVKKA